MGDDDRVLGPNWRRREHAAQRARQPLGLCSIGLEREVQVVLDAEPSEGELRGVLATTERTGQDRTHRYVQGAERLADLRRLIAPFWRQVALGLAPAQVSAVARGLFGGGMPEKDDQAAFAQLTDDGLEPCQPARLRTGPH